MYGITLAQAVTNSLTLSEEKIVHVGVVSDMILKSIHVCTQGKHMSLLMCSRENGVYILYYTQCV